MRGYLKVGNEAALLLVLELLGLLVFAEVGGTEVVLFQGALFVVLHGRVDGQVGGTVDIAGDRQVVIHLPELEEVALHRIPIHRRYLQVLHRLRDALSLVLVGRDGLGVFHRQIHILLDPRVFQTFLSSYPLLGVFLQH